jgi:nitrite reductase/ring-hydroxylating ferredoxin subunit
MLTRWKQDFPIFNAEDSYVTRREFTKFLGLTSLAFLAGTLAAAGRKLVQRTFSREDSAVAVAGINDIPVGGHKLFRYPTEHDPCILVRLSEDKFAAFDQRCTHLSCPVLFDATSKQLACPCHQGFFSAEDGRPLAGPPKRALRQFTVTTENAQVVVGQILKQAARPPESGGQRDRDEVEITRGEVPKHHSHSVRLETSPRAVPSGPRCPPNSGGRVASLKQFFRNPLAGRFL